MFTMKSISASEAYLLCKQADTRHRLRLSGACGMKYSAVRVCFNTRKCSNYELRRCVRQNCRQFETATLVAKMMDDIRIALSPLFLISYIFGMRTFEYPTSKLRMWCGFLYILLLWSMYNLLLVCTLMYYLHSYSIEYQFCFWLNYFTVILSVVLGIYHNKKFRSCLSKLAIVDSTLEKLGTTTNYQKLYTAILLVTFGWCLFVLWTTYTGALWHRDQSNAIESLFVAFMMEYSTYTNLIDDLIITCTLGYIEFKFDQVNEHLRKMEKENERGLQLACEHYALYPCQTGYPKSTGSECVTWIVIHLHLELRKISRELNSIFGLQMTVKMGTYFAFMALAFRDLFNVILITNYVDKTTLFAILIVSFLILNIYRLFIINYICEKITVKANSMGDIINKVPYSTSDDVARENISQLILQMSLVPLRFHGLGLFQFGLKFFQGFSSSVTTVIVILVQSHTKT